MARAKNTSRAEARKRTRDEARAEMAAEQEPEDGGEAIEGSTSTEKTSWKPRRSGVLFKWPDLRADARSIPGMFRAKRLMWIPFVLVIVGFVMGLFYDQLPVEIAPYVGLYYQWFFNPLALFTYFIAGFLAPKASYMVGGLSGLFTGFMYLILVLITGASADPTQTFTPGDLAVSGVVLLLQTTLIGAAAGGFAGWYRDFLRRMQDNSRNRQAQREQEAKAKRAADRQEARKQAKQRPAS